MVEPSPFEANQAVHVAEIRGVLHTTTTNTGGDKNRGVCLCCGVASCENNT